MTHHPKFWAARLETRDQQIAFWVLVDQWNFDGETAYCRVLGI